MAERSVSFALIARDGASAAFEKVTRAVDKTERKLQEFKDKNGRIEVKLKGDVSDLETKIERAKRKLETVPNIERAKITADISELEVKLKIANRELKEFGKRKASNSVFGSIGRDVTGFLGSLDKAGVSFTKWTGAIAGGNAGLVGLAGTIASTATALGSLSGVVGLLPAVLAGAGIGLVTLKLAIGGVHKAISDSGDAKAYGDDLAALGPNAAAATKSIVKLKDGLSKSVSEETFKGLSKDIDSLGKDFIPVLNKQLDATAKSFNLTAKGTLDWLKQAKNLKSVNTLLGNAGKFTRGVTSALGPLIKGFITFATAGSDYLSSFGTGLKGAADSFYKFSQRVTASVGGNSSSFDKWVDRGLAGLDDLGAALKSTGGIIAGLFRAGGPGKSNPLASLATGVERINKAVNSANGQAKLKALFAAMKSGANSVKSALPQVVKAIEDLSPALSGVVSGSSGAFGAELKLYARTAIILAPAINAIVGALVPFAPVLGTIAATLKIASVATKAWSAAMVELDLEMDANPIGLVVIAVALLAAGLVIAYKKSQTFREVVQVAFAAVADYVLGIADKILAVYEAMFAGLGHLPGKLGAPFRAAAGEIKKVRDQLAQAKKQVDDFPKVTKLKGDISDLTTKINRAEAQLHKVPPQKQVKIIGDINRLIAARISAQNQLNKLHGKTIVINAVYKRTSQPGTYGNGLGVLKRAGGGPVQRDTPYLVGEEGPELIVPRAAGRVLTANQTRSIAGTGSPSIGGLSLGTRGRAGGITVHVHFNGRPLATKSEIAAMVVDAVNTSVRAGTSNKLIRGAVA